jgi:hypothetical protein
MGKDVSHFAANPKLDDGYLPLILTGKSSRLLVIGYK